jgi:hypothetical protein
VALAIGITLTGLSGLDESSEKPTTAAVQSAVEQSVADVSNDSSAHQEWVVELVGAFETAGLSTPAAEALVFTLSAVQSVRMYDPADPTATATFAPTATPTSAMPSNSPTQAPTLSSSGGSNCDYGREVCMQAASAIGKPVDWERCGGFQFAGDYSMKGCYTYDGGIWAGCVFYGLVDGEEVSGAAELTGYYTGAVRLEAPLYPSCDNVTESLAPSMQAPTKAPTQAPTLAEEDGGDTDTGLIILEHNDDSACGLQAQLSMEVEAGKTYYIGIGAFGGAVGDFELGVTGPAGELCEAEQVHGDSDDGEYDCVKDCPGFSHLRSLGHGQGGEGGGGGTGGGGGGPGGGGGGGGPHLQVCQSLSSWFELSHSCFADCAQPTDTAPVSPGIVLYSDAYYHCHAHAPGGEFIGIDYDAGHSSLCDSQAHEQQVKHCRPLAQQCMEHLHGLHNNQRQQQICSLEGPCADFFRCADTSLLVHHCTAVSKYTKVVRRFRDQCQKESGELSQCEADQVSAAVEVPFGSFGQAACAAVQHHTRQPVPVGDWLEAANRNLRQYAGAFAAYGYEDSSILAYADKKELQEAFEEMGVKKPHRKLVLKAHAALQQPSK